LKVIHNYRLLEVKNIKVCKNNKKIISIIVLLQNYF